jgi:hypothetical protein
MRRKKKGFYDQTRITPEPIQNFLRGRGYQQIEVCMYDVWMCVYMRVRRTQHKAAAAAVVVGQRNSSSLKTDDRENF